MLILSKYYYSAAGPTPFGAQRFCAVKILPVISNDSSAQSFDFVSISRISGASVRFYSETEVILESEYPGRHCGCWALRQG